MMQTIENQIALEIKVRVEQVKAAVALLDGGATVPFVARYRKEATGGLDDIQLRELEYRLGYLREMAERREAIVKSIEAQGKLTPELQAAIAAAPTKQELEDLYLPFKQKRRTKGMIAREAGIEPLADALFANPQLAPLTEAEKFISPAGTVEGADFSNALAVLDGVRDILSERWAEDAALVQSLREWLWSSADFASKLVEGKNEADPEVAKFRNYFDYSESIHKVPSHRALAMFRGRAAEFLEVKLAFPLIESALSATNSIAPSAVKPVSLRGPPMI
jgi:protein Tex